MRGLVLTGWQRYDHLAVLCELLPAGTPSLVLSLLTVSAGRFQANEVFKRFEEVMGCQHGLYQQHLERNGALTADAGLLGTDRHLYARASACQFPGVEIFRLTQQLNDLVKRVNDYVYDVNVHRAWLTEYNFRRNYSSPARIDEQLLDGQSLASQLTYMITQAQEKLQTVFDKYTVAEWIEQNIYPSLLKLEHVQKEATRIGRVREWTSRPLAPLKELKRYGVDV